MNLQKVLKRVSFLFALTASTVATAAVTYEVKITNGSEMPISGGVLYTANGSLTRAGKVSTPGFIQLCQMGDAAARFAEIQKSGTTSSSVQTMGPILPGQSITAAISLNDPSAEGIHFEAMYGKTKDVCAIASINSHSLYALKQHVTPMTVVKDNVVTTGAFLNPVVQDEDYGNRMCANAKDAVSCLRELALANTGAKTVRFFSGYFPSVVNFLEKKYGSEDTQTLLFPTSGAVELRIKLKH